MVRFQLASTPSRIHYVKEQFTERKNSADVYMALANGVRDQDQLVKITKLSQATVSKICTYLEERNFIAKHRNPTNKKHLLFSWTDAETVLQLSKIAKEFIK
ncbi:MAG TPA: helix-turn-helix domain-containing protein [Verrucomicrobiae bacterium]|jgi:DNA-binding MarR family transcriptional regulator